ncbi:MAG: hypothetical protein ABIH76_01130 [Candidatus Bathyarchaeota archaeon]
MFSISFAFLSFPAYAVEEEGNAILCIYSDSERTTSVELDSNGRYYLAPGTEYYFTIEGITKYSVGEEVTFWAYRVNTAENIEIAQLTVDSNPFDAIFSCIFPEDYYEEPVQIKYGINLESDWYFAQEEIWIDFLVGNGILYVYMDAARTTEAPTDEHENYIVLSGVEYYFTLNGVTEYPDTVKIWGSYWNPPQFWKFTNIQIGEFTVSENIEFAWTIPDLSMETTLRIKYGTDLNGLCPHWRFAAKPTCFILPLPRKLFVVNEIILGPIGAIAALFIGYTIKTLPKRKNKPANQSH